MACTERDAMTILGSLVLHSDREVPELPIQLPAAVTLREGRHVNSRHTGSYREYFDIEPLEIMVPQRYKRMSILTDSPLREQLAEALSGLDSQYGDARQLYKLNQLMSNFRQSFRATVNISNGGADGTAMSGAFYLLAQSEPMYVGVVFDSNTGSVQLVWSDLDFTSILAAQGALNYSFVKLPTLKFRPLFIPSQSLCSKWWRMSQTLCPTKYGLIRACNALERMLYKNPHQP